MSCLLQAIKEATRRNTRNLAISGLIFAQLKGMANSQMLLAAIFLLALGSDPIVVNANFYAQTTFYWGAQHSSMNATDIRLVLDQTSGSGIKGYHAYLFGSFEMLIKLVPGNSAGTVTAYYVSSYGNRRDEIDFEFLGNVSGQPYIIHTNIYTQGNGSREQQFYPWFDPTAAFHNYTIHWNPSEVVWYVDSVPIRVFRNYESQGIAYPNKQAMTVFSSLWNADSWATRGGLVKINWRGSPFIARLHNFKARACKYFGPASITQCAAHTPANWWTSPAYSQLSSANLAKLNQVRAKYMIYDYCKDFRRFKGQMPPECFKPQF